MPENRRKHPLISVLQESPQGSRFLVQMLDLLGRRMQWAPTEMLGDIRVFMVRGPDGWGVLFDQEEFAEGDVFVHRLGFQHVARDFTTTLSELTAYRWNPWPDADPDGDQTLLTGGPAARRTLAPERNMALARERDTLVTVVESLGSRGLLGVSRSDIDALVERWEPSETEWYPKARSPQPGTAPAVAAGYL